MTTSTVISKVLVVGASGSFGSAVARALAQRPGFEVRATVRPGGNPVSIPGVTPVPADATDEASLMAASEGADIIVYGLNVPYQRWHTEMEPNVEVLSRVAERRGALVVLPGNVYGLGPDFSAPLGEDCAHQAPTEKGAIRNRIEARLRKATENGARLLIVRAGDYFGPGATHTSWYSMLTGSVGMSLMIDPAEGREVPHQWAYLPDVGENTARLLEHRADLPAVAEFHHGGPQLTQTELQSATRAASRKRRLLRMPMPWWLIKLMARVNPLLREVLEMRYLWRVPLLLSDRKMRGFLGQVAETPLVEALSCTLAAQGLRGAEWRG